MPATPSASVTAPSLCLLPSLCSLPFPFPSLRPAADSPRAQQQAPPRIPRPASGLPVAAGTSRRRRRRLLAKLLLPLPTFYPAPPLPPAPWRLAPCPPPSLIALERPLVAESCPSHLLRRAGYERVGRRAGLSESASLCRALLTPSPSPSPSPSTSPAPVICPRPPPPSLFPSLALSPSRDPVPPPPPSSCV